MWKYRRVNTLLERNWKLFFQGVPLLLSPQGFILSEVSKDLEDKIKKAPHLFMYVEGAVKQKEEEKAEEKEEKKEIVVKKRRGRKPKQKTEE